MAAKRKTKADEQMVDVELDLGEFASTVKAAAKKSGVGLNEFIVDAIESRIRQSQDFQPHNFTPHGGKHKMGKYSGYEVKDGKYYPSPSWVERFNLLFAERQSIYNLVNSVIRQSQERLIEVEKAISKAKTDLVKDLGLDPEKDWTYYGGGDRYLTESTKDEKGEE